MVNAEIARSGVSVNALNAGQLFDFHLDTLGASGLAEIGLLGIWTVRATPVTTEAHARIVVASAKMMVLRMSVCPE